MNSRAALALCQQLKKTYLQTLLDLLQAGVGLLQCVEGAGGDG